MMSLWDALRMNMMISYQELVRTFPRPSIIDILPRLYTAEEVYSRFKEHEFRATNDFKKCRLMVTGKIKKSVLLHSVRIR